ncbi:probable hydroxyacid aldolase protein [Fulvimarina pelagi HTCC2506]|uniref:Probable hydroxyacid aldolase protein n=2 Tax=Fulvimarina pelagi TaxID=217511 RepID=Q0G052_9HYPH|nr:aldolase/citrate lyase family protein [Fulvimarina pelagi]EAU40741.1 probable hydroxyacid aldolase protein [Fulvimarina pelagi HTCC2506]BAT31283.1 probable hydroxyacid aldolase protein [Fulvimarina pelagi]
MSSHSSPKDRFLAMAGSKSVLSAWLASPDPFTQEAFLKADYDFVVLDMQHGLLDRADVRDAITRCYAFGKGAFVRVPVSGFGNASWVLDMGAQGVIMPMIESAEDARVFVKHMKYPPLGLRSYAPIRAAPLAKGGDVDAYVETANSETFAFAMIETRTALDALDEIAAIDGIDGLFVGPADLSIALSDDSRVDIDGERLKDAMRRVAEAAERHGKVAAAYAGDAAHASAYWCRGYDYVGISMDLKIVAEAAELLAKEAKG